MRTSIRFQITTILTLWKFRRERKPGWLQNAKTLLIGTRDLLPLDSTCRCSRTKEWNSDFAGSISDPLTQPCSNSLCSSCPKRWKAEESSPQMKISGQKQLSPCPTGERAATVESMVLTRSSRKRRQSLRNFFCKKLLYIFSRGDDRRVPFKKCSSQVAPKHERFGSRYASHFPKTDKLLLHFTFSSEQYTNRESSPNAR